MIHKAQYSIETSYESNSVPLTPDTGKRFGFDIRRLVCAIAALPTKSGWVIIRPGSQKEATMGH